MSKIKKRNSLSDFIFYTITVIIIATIFILQISIKNESIKTQMEIEKLNNIYKLNIDIVKELQSSRNYFTSYEYITNSLSNKMIAATPETLVINIENIK